MQCLLRALAFLTFAVFLTGCIAEQVAPPPANARIVYPTLETTPVTSRDDAADDPAIWIHPQDPNASLIIGTDKQYGLEVYDLSGDRVQSIPAGRTNNVDLRMLAEDGAWSAIAAASNRTTNTISLFAIDNAGQVFWLQDSEVETGLTEPYGLCMFRNQVGLQVFVNDTDGRYQQWLLEPRGSGSALPQFEAQLLREFTVPSQPEGCVADDDNQRLFLGVEAEGVRVVAANHVQPVELQSIADIDGDILLADVEGMILYLDGEGGYLVVSSQGNYSYSIYDRRPPYSYRGSFVVADNTALNIDGSQETDGLAASSLLKTEVYPEGLLVVQDGFNTLPRRAQHFKVISWQDLRIALELQALPTD